MSKPKVFLGEVNLSALEFMVNLAAELAKQNHRISRAIASDLALLVTKYTELAIDSEDQAKC